MSLEFAENDYRSVTNTLIVPAPSSSGSSALPSTVPGSGACWAIAWPGVGEVTKRSPGPHRAIGRVHLAVDHAGERDRSFELVIGGLLALLRGLGFADLDFENGNNACRIGHDTHNTVVGGARATTHQPAVVWIDDQHVARLHFLRNIYEARQVLG